ncbi:hypothetical protein [Streptomyces sp. NPDC059272]|uniref:hypothetical protein n=1 Tax=Streptomyces sp. NPDC059272 TaxID=3346800 RepID=UPI003684D589
MTFLGHPTFAGRARNPGAPEDVLVPLAGRQGLSLCRGRPADAVVEALPTYAATPPWTFAGTGSPRKCASRIAGHPDPAIRDACADFVRQLDVDDPHVRVAVAPSTTSL